MHQSIASDITAIILAGGRGRRFGRDKALSQSAANQCPLGSSGARLMPSMLPKWWWHPAWRVAPAGPTMDGQFHFRRRMRHKKPYGLFL